ncbi:MAG: hypothetical protein ACI9SY_000079 [Candidatus Paceibacteria bacterium]|jgi:hypothetical protein
MNNILNTSIKASLFQASLLLLVWFTAFSFVNAAVMQVSPSTGVYQAGATFSVDIQIRTGGDSVNASEGTLKFNPNQLSVVSVGRSSSIFNLWTAEPAFSNSAGTVTFSGGTPSGYTGSVGRVVTVTFRTKGAGTSQISFSNGSVLANDGRGTNILTSMNGGSYTISAATVAPQPEVIIEYVPSANTPDAPSIDSSTHPDPEGWSNLRTAELTWVLPADVTSVRTLLNSSPSSIPSRVYENPIRSITLDDLDEGVSFFHLQFKNSDGWGGVRSYQLGVDTIAPTELEISLATTSDKSNPAKTLQFAVVEETSGIKKYLIKIDADEPYVFTPESGSSTHTLTALEPGYHTVIVEAFDGAGNSVIATYSFTIESFERPVFIDVPTDMSANVVPVLAGTTRPNSSVQVFFNRVGSEQNVYETVSDENGVFTFIPDGTLYSGVYELSARATDQFGAQSELSDVYRIAAQEPGYIRIGTQVINAMSVIVPLILLALLLVLGVWYMLFVYRRFKGVVDAESSEALMILQREFASLHQTVAEQRELLLASRKTKKLTKAESETLAIFSDSLEASQQVVEKEIKDVTALTKDT